MNILLLTYSALSNIGGVERSVGNLAAYLVAAKHRVILVTHSPSVFLASRQRRHGLSTYFLRIPYQCARDWRSRLQSSVRNLLNLLVLIGLVLRYRIQIVHCHHLNVDTYYAHLLTRILGVPHIVTLRGGETAAWVKRSVWRRRYLVRVLRAANHVTAVARTLLHDAAAYVPGVAWKASVIPNPVSPETLESLIHEGSSAGREGTYILFVGRLEAEKDAECLVDSYHAILQADPGFGPELWLIGSGSRTLALQSRAGSGPGRDKIHFLGTRPYDETLCFIRSAMMLVLPSRYEGCPNVVLEAMALGTPVVVADVPALRELVDHGVNGSVFAVGDCTALRDRVLELHRNPELRAVYRSRGRERVGDRHSWPWLMSRYSRLYAALMCRHTTSLLPPRHVSVTEDSR